MHPNDSQIRYSLKLKAITFNTMRMAMKLYNYMLYDRTYIIQIALKYYFRCIGIGHKNI